MNSLMVEVEKSTARARDAHREHRARTQECIIQIVYHIAREETSRLCITSKYLIHRIAKRCAFRYKVSTRRKYRCPSAIPGHTKRGCTVPSPGTSQLRYEITNCRVVSVLQVLPACKIFIIATIKYCII